MTLELKQQDDQPQDDQDLRLALADITEFHSELESFIDARVAALKRLHPELPVAMLRKDLIRGQCLCAVVQRLLKQEQQ